MLVPEISRSLRRAAQAAGLTNAARFERLARRHTDPFVDSVLAQFHTSGGLHPALQHYKLYSLDLLLQKHRPRLILELGSGSSTAVFGRYCGDSGAGLTTVDESPHWIENTRSLTSVHSGEAHIDFVQAEKGLDLSCDPPEAYYQYRSSVPGFDFVFIDGPSLTFGKTKYLNAVCRDVFVLCETQEPSAIVVDMRAPTVEAIRSRLGARYDWVPSDILIRQPRADFQYFTVFLKR